jgi:hypothetical protein
MRGPVVPGRRQKVLGLWQKVFAVIANWALLGSALSR